MGTAGAVIATVFAQVISVIVSLFLISKKRITIYIKERKHSYS